MHVPIARAARARLVGAAAAVALLTACGDDNTVGVQQTPTIGVALAAPTLAVTAGQSGTVNVTITRGGGFTDAVTLTLEGAPTGVTGTFNPASVGAGATTSVLTLAAAASTTAGTYNLTVRAQGTGVTAATAPLTLTVNATPTIGVTLGAATLAVTQGQGGTVNVAIARGGGFAGAVDLTLEGAPAGVTGSFNPASVPGGASASVLTVAAAATTAPGTYNLTVRGQGTGVTAVIAPLTLTVNPAPSVSIAVAPTSLSVVQGQNATTTLTLTRAGGFAGSVDVTVEGLPANVTATASPATIAAGASTSTITVAAGATAATGPSTLTVRVRGTGVADQTVLLPITVTAAPQVPAYTLALTPTSATVQQSGTATVTIALARTGGFTGPVTLALEGAPTGVTGAFSPNPATADASTLTLTASATAATGTFSATVRGTAQGLTDRTATLSITVSPAVQVGNYTLSVTPATVSVQQGQTGTATVNLARTGGFAGGVTITTSGAPAGLTVTGPAAAVTDNTAALSIAAASTLAPGTYTFTVRSAAAGLTDQTATVNVTVTAAPPTGSISLAVTPNPVSVAAGASAQATLNITRAGGFTGAVAIAATGAPAGLTVTPASASTTDPSVALTVAATAAVAPGSYPVTITGTGTGVANATTTLNVTVTAPAGFSVALTPTTFTLQQGASTTLTVNLTRTGGFAGTVNLTASGLPTGVTASFSPSGITGLSSTLTLTASATAATGPFTLTVTGASTGLPNATATASGNVTAASSGGNVPLAFCQDAIPVWVAYQTSPNGPWTRATVSATGVANVPVSGTQSAVAYIVQTGNSYSTTVVYGAAGDLTTYGASACQAAPAGKTITGTVAGLTGPTDQALISLGSAVGSANGSQPSYTLNNVPAGPRDLLATRSTVAFTGGTITSTLDKIILRRNLNIPNGGTIPVLDFSSAEAFAPASANVTFANAGTDIVFPIVSYTTANGTGGSFYNGAFGALAGGGAPPTTQRYFGIPTDKQAAGDFHMLSALAAPQNATGFDATNARYAGQFFRTVSDRTLTLGPTLTAPTVTMAATTPYPRPRVQATRQTEYGDVLFVTFNQSGTGVAPRTVSLVQLSSYTGGGNWDVTVPDFTGAEGFDPTWLLRPGVQTAWTVAGAGGTLSFFIGGQPTEGATFRYGIRTGTLAAAIRASYFRR